MLTAFANYGSDCGQRSSRTGLDRIHDDMSPPSAQKSVACNNISEVQAEAGSSQPAQLLTPSK
jgi:hypothetical protein